jgi:mismatch-specific thymine-DNA glycosylase
VNTLPHYLRPGLRLVFIGYNPGIESARAGHYYAFHGNVFWRQLAESGLVARVVSHLDDARLMDEAGLGLTDLCPRPTTSAGELSKAEQLEGARHLHRELREAQPLVAVFGGRGIYSVFGREALGLSARDLAGRPWGRQIETVGATELWVIPSSSGLASKWHVRRLELLRALGLSLDGEHDARW